MTDGDGKYNGWANRETWALNLHLTSNEGDYKYYRDKARRLSRGDLAALIKSDVEDIREALFDGAKQSGRLPDAAVLMMQDMLSLERVEWFDVADAFLDEVKEDVKP